MQKLIFGIFAHPDDESFGPSGTILMEAAAGTEVHLISLTMGQNGMNPDAHDDLGAVRKREWQQAGVLMGVTSQHDFGYTDGQLSNTDMIEAAERIERLVREVAVEREVEVEFMTNDLNGISGHIDHIVAARAACLAFYRLKQDDKRLSRIRLACLPQSRLARSNIDWLYMEAGRPDEMIDEVVDARQYRDKIVEIMRAHHTQRRDGEQHIETLGEDLGLNYFYHLS